MPLHCGKDFFVKMGDYILKMISTAGSTNLYLKSRRPVLRNSYLLQTTDLQFFLYCKSQAEIEKFVPLYSANWEAFVSKSFLVNKFLFEYQWLLENETFMKRFWPFWLRFWEGKNVTDHATIRVCAILKWLRKWESFLCSKMPRSKKKIF